MPFVYQAIYPHTSDKDSLELFLLGIVPLILLSIAVVALAILELRI